MTQEESEIPAVEALKKLDWAVSEMWKHTTHEELYCDAEYVGDPIHIVATWSCGGLTSNSWVINPNKKTMFWLGKESDPKRRTVDADLEEDQELVFCARQLIIEIDSSIDVQACQDAFEAEHCE